MDSYKSRLAGIDCRHFDNGHGRCPFGSSCFYRHADEQGRPMVRCSSASCELNATRCNSPSHSRARRSHQICGAQAIETRWFGDSEGKLSSMQPVMLSAFLERSNLLAR